MTSSAFRAAVRRARSQPSLTRSVTEIFGLSAICLAIGHFAEPSHRSPILLAGSAVFLVPIVIWYCLKRGFWQSAMLLLVLSHFCYVNASGGLWNFMAVVMVIGTGLWLPRAQALRRDSLLKPDGLTLLLVLALLIPNALGWIFKNPAPLPRLIQGAVPLFAYLAVFWRLSRTPITPARVHVFLIVTAVMATWMLGVGSLQRANLNTINTPVLGYYDAETAARRQASLNRPDESTFAHSELYGEYAALVLILFLPFLFAGGTGRLHRPISLVALLTVLIAPGSILLSGSRSAVFISLFGLCLTVMAMQLARLMRVRSYVKLLASTAAVAALVISIGDLFGLDIVTRKLTEVSDAPRLTLVGIVSGTDIDRGFIFQTGLNRLDEGSWWIGYGSGLPEYNLEAWTGSALGFVPSPGGWVKYTDLHSQYMQAVILYGWVGTAAYFGLIVLLLLRVSRRLTRVEYAGETGLLAMVLAICFVAFMVDQFKVAALRSMNYQMIHWIWLGIAHSAARALPHRANRQLLHATTSLKQSGGELIKWSARDEAEMASAAASKR